MLPKPTYSCPTHGDIPSRKVLRPRFGFYKCPLCGSTCQETLPPEEPGRAPPGDCLVKRSHHRAGKHRS